MRSFVVATIIVIMLARTVHSFPVIGITSSTIRLCAAQFSRARPGAPSRKDPTYRRKPRPIKTEDSESEESSEPDRPFTLPPGQHRPKQSLGQNYLSDQNYVLKICDAFQDDSQDGHRVVEIGPGLGALTRVLLRKYPKMTAIEIDERSIKILKEKLPELQVIHKDVLQFEWAKMAEEKGGKLNVIANLPYYITSQVLFGLADAHKSINKAVVTMQWEVGERVTAQPGNKDYGIPSVVFQLYGKTHLNFKIPPKVFFPVPKVDSALVTIDFSQPHHRLHLVEPEHLRKVITLAFRQRRKMIRQSLKEMLDRDKVQLPAKWATQRPEDLKPQQFLELTLDLYGPKGSATSNRCLSAAARAAAETEAQPQEQVQEQIQGSPDDSVPALTASSDNRESEATSATVSSDAPSGETSSIRTSGEAATLSADVKNHAKVGGDSKELPKGTRLFELLRNRKFMESLESVDGTPAWHEEKRKMDQGDRVAVLRQKVAAVSTASAAARAPTRSTASTASSRVPVVEHRANARSAPSGPWKAPPPASAVNSKASSMKKAEKRDLYDASNVWRRAFKPGM